MLEYVLYPVTEDALPVQERTTEWLAAARPVPDRAMVSVAALLATVTLPLALPAVEGVNVAVRVAVCPGVKIRPVETPLALKPAPETLTLEIVILEFPEFVSVTVWLLVVDKFTLPKLKELVLAFRDAVAALTVSVAALLTAVPALLVMDTANFAVLSAVVVAGVV